MDNKNNNKKVVKYPIYLTQVKVISIKFQANQAYTVKTNNNSKNPGEDRTRDLNPYKKHRICPFSIKIGLNQYKIITNSRCK